MPKLSEKKKLQIALCEKFCFDMLAADSSDDEEEFDIMENFLSSTAYLLSHRRIRPYMPKSARRILRNFDDKMLPIRPPEVSHILNLIKDDPNFKTHGHTKQLPTELQLKMVLFRLGASGDDSSIRKISATFDIGDGGTVQKVTNRVFKAILNLKKKCLHWPNESERLKIVTATRNEMPGCVGYIGCLEMKITEWPFKSQKHISEEDQYSAKLQAVCDYKLRIRKVKIVLPGCVKDGEIFLDSSLAKNPDKFLSASQWIAGDSRYPLTSYLLTPFDTNSSEYTRADRQLFNENFSAYRERIDYCFGRLKETFVSLNDLKFRTRNLQNLKQCRDWIKVCCILHNILITYNMKDTKVLQSDVFASTNTRSGLLEFFKGQEGSN